MNDWLMRVEGGLAASFKQPDGTSRPGTDWKIGIKRGDEIHTVLGAHLSRAGYRAGMASRQPISGRGTAMGYLNDMLGKGWTPGQPLPAITITNPQGGQR